MHPRDLFDEQRNCVNCAHPIRDHWPAVSDGNVLRVFCDECAQSPTRMMADEGGHNPTPVFIETSFGFPDPCLGPPSPSWNQENFLPRSSGETGRYRFHLVAQGPDGEHEIHFSLDGFRRRDLERLAEGETISDKNVYKLKLYWEQEGLCKGCQRRFAFENLEMDHINPESGGGELTVGNLQLLCSTCNKLKGTGTMNDLFEKLDRRGVRDEKPRGDKESTQGRCSVMD